MRCAALPRVGALIGRGDAATLQLGSKSQAAAPNRAPLQVLSQLTQDGVDLSRVSAVSGSGQQHGSIYWKHGAADTLGSLHQGCVGEPLAPCHGACRRWARSQKLHRPRWFVLRGGGWVSHARVRRASLVTQLKDSFAFESSPIWMDSSTTEQCEVSADPLDDTRFC